MPVEMTVGRRIRPLLRCEQCGREFELDDDELQRLRRLRVPSPRRCPACHGADRAPAVQAGRTTVCADCGVTFELAIRPRGRRQRFYCEACFKRRVESRYGGGRTGDRLG